VLDRQPSKPLCAVLLALMTAVALALRLGTLDFALPFAQEPDPHILGQIETLSQAEVSDEDVFYSSIYPHFLARTSMLFGDVVTPPSAAELDAMTLDEHLATASRLHHRVRLVIAWLSVLIVPAAFWLATFFVERRWALFAAALAAVSTLSLQFGQQARPHAAVGPLIALAVAGCMHLRRRGDARSFVIAGALCSLAIACLTNALAVLFPAGLAFLLRNGARRRLLDARLLIPIALIALAVRVYYPFFFVATPAGAEIPQEEGTFSFAWQTINWNDFRGDGFPTLFMTFWYYEPVASLLALAGIAVWIARKSDGTSEWSERRKDLLVALSFALTYAIVIGLQRRNQQRFMLPLVPFVFAAAAYGMRALSWKLAAWPLRAVAALALAVPAWACLGYTMMRTRPQTLEQVAQWIAANVDRERERVALHLNWDVPLARTHANLFDADGKRRPSNLSPWTRYQHELMDAHFRGERWNLEALYPDKSGQQRALQQPVEYLAELGADFVVLPGGSGVAVAGPARALRTELEKSAEKVLSLPLETRPAPSGLEGLDTPHFTLFVSTARWFGPQIDVFRLRRER